MRLSANNEFVPGGRGGTYLTRIPRCFGEEVRPAVPSYSRLLDLDSFLLLGIRRWAALKKCFLLLLFWQRNDHYEMKLNMFFLCLRDMRQVAFFLSAQRTWLRTFSYELLTFSFSEHGRSGQVLRKVGNPKIEFPLILTRISASPFTVTCGLISTLAEATGN